MVRSQRKVSRSRKSKAYRSRGKVSRSRRQSKTYRRKRVMSKQARRTRKRTRKRQSLRSKRLFGGGTNVKLAVGDGYYMRAVIELADNTLRARLTDQSNVTQPLDSHWTLTLLSPTMRRHIVNKLGGEYNVGIQLKEDGGRPEQEATKLSILYKEDDAVDGIKNFLSIGVKLPNDFFDSRGIAEEILSLKGKNDLHTFLSS